ncbi:hypothetical protein VTO42DRAFT_912 [Malbranchea cinnamomea]
MPTSDFFRDHPASLAGSGYRPRDREPLRFEFDRLARYMRWSQEERRKQWIECLVSEIKMLRANGFDNPLVVRSGRWREKQALDNTHINIVDWVDSERAGKDIYYFPGRTDLDLSIHVGYFGSLGLLGWSILVGLLYGVGSTRVWLGIAVNTNEYDKCRDIPRR